MHRSATFLRAILSVLVVLGLGTSPIMAAPPVSPGDILVADQGGTIHHFSASGADLGAFASGLSSPSWITADSSGNIYVTEYTGNRIDKLSPSGTNLLTIITPFTPGGVRVTSDGTIYVAAYGEGSDKGIYRYSESGAALGLFAKPVGISGDFIAFDASGNLYAPNFATGNVLRISPTGADLGTFATLVGAEGIAFDSSGNLYVSSYNTNIIEQFSQSGTDLGSFASIGSGSAYGVAFDSAGNLYVVNYGGPNIHKFSPSGADLGIFASAGLVLPRDLVIVPPGGPATNDQCKNGGWETFDFPRTFKNQGDCIQFVNTGK